jgi:hypothetical protein
MDEVQELCDSERYSSSSKPCKFYEYNLCQWNSKGSDDCVYDSESQGSWTLRNSK